MERITLKVASIIQKKMGYTLEPKIYGDRCRGCLLTMMVVNAGGMPEQEWQENTSAKKHTTYVKYAAKILRLPIDYLMAIMDGFDDVKDRGCYNVDEEYGYQDGLEARILIGE